MTLVVIACNWIITEQFILKLLSAYYSTIEGREKTSRYVIYCCVFINSKSVYYAEGVKFFTK
jgi:hypothetical protein